MLNNMKISTKLTLGFSVLLLLLVSVGAVGFVATMYKEKGLGNVLEQLAVSQLVSNMTDNVYLAQIAAREQALTKDISHGDRAAEYMSRALAAKKAAMESVHSDESRRAIDAIEALAAEYSHQVREYQRLQVEMDKMEQEMRAAANAVDAIIHKLMDHLIDKYEQMEQGGETLTLLHVKNYGNVIILLEATERMRVARRDFVIAINCPQKIAEQEAARKLFSDHAALFRSEAEKIQETLLVETAKALVAEAVELVESWARLCNESMNLMALQAEEQKRAVEIAHAIEQGTMTLTQCLEKTVAEVRQSVATTKIISDSLIIGTTLFAIVFGIVCAIWLATNIANGINFAVKTMFRVAGEGDLSVEVDPIYLHRKDEIGALAHGLNSVLHDYHAVDEMAKSLAQGDWRVTMKAKGPRDSMNIRLDQMIVQVNKVLGQIHEAVKQVATGADEVASASNTLAGGAQESAASLEEVSASMSEINGQTKANAESASEARDLAHQAAHAASSGQVAMGKMTESMDRITKNAEEIQRVIKVIDDIAFQTNLLALNAAVEAARAGQHGKGFAVVAEEVRNLAARSAKAAKETADLISTSNEEIQRGGEVTTQTSEVLGTIVAQIQKTTDLVTNIANASNVQAQGVAQITVGLHQIDEVTQKNTAVAEESASAATEMSGTAHTLRDLVAKFQLRT